MPCHKPPETHTKTHTVWGKRQEHSELREGNYYIKDYLEKKIRNEIKGDKSNKEKKAGERRIKD